MAGIHRRATGRVQGLDQQDDRDEIMPVNPAARESATRVHMKRVRRVILAVLGGSPEQRPAILARLCRGNEALRKETESLLSHDATDLNILDRVPETEVIAALAARPPTDNRKT